MNRGFKGLLTGTLALAAMEAVLTTAHGQRLPEIAAAPGRVARWFISPTTPLIPDLRNDATKKYLGALADAYQQAARIVPAGGASAGPPVTLPASGAPKGNPAPKPKPPTISPFI